MMLHIRNLVYYTFILFYLPSSALFGQIYTDNAIIYNEAEGYLQGREFEEALPLYLTLNRKGISNANIDYKMGLCYLEMPGKKLQSIPFLESAATNTSGEYSSSLETSVAPHDALLKLAMAYRLNAQFAKSKQSLLIYKDSVNDDLDLLADFYLKQLEIAECYFHNNSSGKLNLVTTSGNYSIYNPSQLNDSIVYYMEQRPFYNAILEGEFVENSISEVNNLVPMIGTEEELTINSISPDGKFMILTVYIAGKGNELVYSDKNEKGEWSNFSYFEAPINSPSNENFASVTSSNNEMYFSSNRPGGIGGSDIYYTRKDESGIWSEPKNLGAEINTPFNEDLCYVSADGNELFINSEGHLSMGGYDLYYLVRDEDMDWSQPVNLGTPFSTLDDDNFISVSPQGKILLSRYDEKLSDKQNIYNVGLGEDFALRKVFVRNQLAFSDTIPPKEVKYNLLMGDSEEKLVDATTSIEGKALNLLTPGSYVYNFTYNDTINAVQKVLIPDDFSPDELTLDAPAWEVIYSKTSAVPIHEQIVLRDILFEFDSYNVRQEYIGMLDSIALILKTKDGISLKIEGHTDALGSKEYNYALSQKRANEVLSILKSKGVGVAKLEVIARGEDMPVAINKNQDGTDNIDGRKYNRRVSVNFSDENESVSVRRINTVPSQLKK